jgi:hypothetical protein
VGGADSFLYQYLVKPKLAGSGRDVAAVELELVHVVSTATLGSDLVSLLLLPSSSSSSSPPGSSPHLRQASSPGKEYLLSLSLSQTKCR